LKATPLRSSTRAVVYQPCGTEALHPVLLNGTGLSVKVATNDAVEGGGGCVCGGVPVDDAGLELHAANHSAVVIVARMPDAGFMA
jgi:hypothetical protein